MKNKKTIILHDTFLYRGGGERLVIYMRDALSCDLATGFFDTGSYSKANIVGKNSDAKLIELMKSSIFTKGFRHIKLKLVFLFKTKFLKNYDHVIFSGDCISAVRNCRKNTNKIYYCHTPPRYIFDKKEWYESQLTKHYPRLYPIVRPLYRLIREVFKRQYLRNIAQMDTILVNSQNVADRVREYCGVESQILYPPVDISKFSDAGLKDVKTPYFLSFARLAKLKRVDMVVKAFKNMPDKNLVLTYGENDPEREAIFELAKWCDNITFHTGVSDEKLIDLISGAIATIYIPMDEDFGMSPVESMSCGTPVLGVAEGGLLETVIDGKTGLLMKPDFTVEDIQKFVEKFEKNPMNPEGCKKRANDFSVESFARDLKECLK